jgi:hypothetical protein
MLIGAQLVARGARSRVGELAAFCSAAALGPEPLQSLIRSPALHPWLRLLSQSLFLTLLLLFVWLLFFAYWSLTGRREALARDGHRWRRKDRNTRTSRAMARGRLAGADLSLPILGGRGIHFTFIVFADLRQTRGSLVWAAATAHASRPRSRRSRVEAA